MAAVSFDTHVAGRARRARRARSAARAGAADEARVASLAAARWQVWAGLGHVSGSSDAFEMRTPSRSGARDAADASGEEDASASLRTYRFCSVAQDCRMGLWDLAVEDRRAPAHARTRTRR